MDYRLEVIGIPVSDVDVSKAFYSDVIVIGEGMPLGEPGATKGAQLVVDDADGNGWSVQGFKR
jgi:catechol 2,3-dioxygenase-like lactoylglutathione lyase family enzyme